jgi:hypothetical protein
MEPTEWGWMLHKTAKGDILKPQKMEQTAAPASLLKIIRCGCSGRCDKNTCSCRKKMDCTVHWHVVNEKGYLAPIETLVKN